MLVGLAGFDERCGSARKRPGDVRTVGLTGVGATCLKATAAEQALVGQAPSEALFERAGELAAAASNPKTDVRGTAEYKRHIVAVYVRRALSEAARTATRA